MKTATFSNGETANYKGKREVNAAYRLSTVDDGKTFDITFSRDSATAEKSVKSEISAFAKTWAMNDSRWEKSQVRRSFRSRSVSPNNRKLIEEKKALFTYEIVTING